MLSVVQGQLEELGFRSDAHRLPIQVLYHDELSVMGCNSRDPSSEVGYGT